MELGLQTFTVRELLTPENLNGSFAQIAGMGIQNLELAVDYLPMPFTLETAKAVRAAADQHGLQIRSCQIKYPTSSADVPLTIAFMQEVGAQILTNSVINLKLLALGRPGLRRYCGQLDRLGEQLAAAGITLAHHNHHFEFRRVGGQTALAFMAAHSSVDFALDTYWTQRAGGDIPALLEVLQGRVLLMHLRDFAGKADCECGRGNIPFEAVLRAAQAAGVRYGMIEQKTKTPMESVEISAAYLQERLTAI